MLTRQKSWQLLCCFLGFFLLASYAATYTAYYVVNNGNNKISICDSTFSTCSSINPDATLTAPTDMIIFNPSNSNPSINFAYISSTTTNALIEICPVNFDGSFGPVCTPYTNAAFGATKRFALNGNYLYVASTTHGSTGASVTSCLVKPCGLISSCTSQIPGAQSAGHSFTDITFSSSYAYLVSSTGGTNSSGDILYCSYSGGTLGICATANVTTVNGGGANPLDTLLNTPIDMAVSNGYAYITNSGSANITACQIAPAPTFPAVTPPIGSLINCVNNPVAGLSSAQGMFFDSSNNIYIASSGNNEVIKCSSVSGTSVSSCAVAGTGFSTPTGVFFY